MLLVSRASILSLFCLLVLTGGTLLRGGMTPYTDRGKTDFDTALQILNPYGTWSKINGAWAYTPLDHGAPYTNGRWIYTEYGWYWKGNLPHSWVTEHYGYWKRGANKIWSWYPGPYWIPQTVEIRATSTHIGWRSAAVDDDGDFIEEAADRWAKTDEWTFVTLAQFAAPITPACAAPPEVAKQLLEDSTDSVHSYWTYREIDRPGPHPADFLALCRDGGMFAPKTLADLLATQPPPPRPVIPGALLPGSTPPPALALATNAPSTFALLGATPDPTADKRKVKYWITMSLPTYWSKPPDDAKPEEIYLYRPDFYQDADGIARRITLWFNPKSRTSLKDLLAGASTSPKANSSSVSAPATPAEPVPSADPFRSPFDEPYHFHSGTASPNSSKNPLPAPAGADADQVPIPSPLVNQTNAAPTNPH
jgi:hypothetical protein